MIRKVGTIILAAFAILVIISVVNTYGMWKVIAAICSIFGVIVAIAGLFIAMPSLGSKRYNSNTSSLKALDKMETRRGWTGVIMIISGFFLFAVCYLFCVV